jgi:hypothetical protein
VKKYGLFMQIVYVMRARAGHDGRSLYLKVYGVIGFYHSTLEGNIFMSVSLA